MLNTTQASSVSLTSINRTDFSSVDTALTESQESEVNITLFIPRNINLEELLERVPPDFNYNIDHFRYILHQITAVPSSNWELIDIKGYTRLSGKLLQDKNHNYKKYLTYLIKNGILEEDRQYIVGVKSKGFRFSPTYLSKVAPVPITKMTLKKSIINGRQKKSNVEKTQQLNFLKKWFNSKFNIDLDGAKKYLRELSEKEGLGSHISEQRFNMRLMPLLQINNGVDSFSVDLTGNRLHTPLTRTMKELKKFFKYDGKTLCSIDIVNSQPYMCRPLLIKSFFQKNEIIDKIDNPKKDSDPQFILKLEKLIAEIENKDDVKLFIKLVSGGTFYEEFGKVLIDKNLIEGDVNEDSVRSKVKEITFSAMYSANTSIGQNPAIKTFEELFPNVYSVFKMIKKGHRNGRYLAISLQKIESELILERICRRINKAFPKIPLFTIHDSIATTEEYVEIVENFMSKILKQYTGIAPKLKIERWG